MRHRNPLRWYSVLSPEYDYIEPVVDWQGPTYTERDWLAVEAHTKAEAKAVAVRHWLRKKAGYLDSGENPYKGVTVELMPPDEARYAETDTDTDTHLRAQIADVKRLEQEAA